MDTQASEQVEQALSEITNYFEIKGNTMEPMELGQVVNFVRSCGIDIGEKDKYELRLAIKEYGYQEERMDNALTFLMYPLEG